MNPTHVHLLINHLAVIGTFLGIIVLLFATFTKASHTYYAAYVVLLISVVGAVIAYATGESAEETIEGIAGIADAATEQHEDSALLTIISFSILGAITFAAIVISRFRETLQRTMAIIVLITSLASFSLAARTAWLGGKIRHTEISVNTNSQPGTEEGDED